MDLDLKGKRAEVLAHTRFGGESTGFEGVHTIVGAGTVCCFTLGHCRGRLDLQDLGVDDLGVADRGSWTGPQFRTILRRCMHWAVTGELPTPGKRVTP